MDANGEHIKCQRPCLHTSTRDIKQGYRDKEREGLHSRSWELLVSLSTETQTPFQVDFCKNISSRGYWGMVPSLWGRSTLLGVVGPEVRGGVPIYSVLYLPG